MINDWWKSDPKQKYWVEITDRPDLGKNIIAPQNAKKGQSTPGYELLKYVKEGDVVFHYWMAPKDKSKRGLVGTSKVVGNLTSGNINWRARGKYSEKVVKNRPAWLWNLAEFEEFENPIYVNVINSKSEKVIELMNKLKKDFKTIYFPFCLKKSKIEVNQTYFAKFPFELTEILEMGYSAYELDKIPKSNSKLTRQLDPEKRKAVETYAESVIENKLSEMGYKLTKYGKPFDFLAEKENEKVKVEVKGKSGEAIAIEVTVNEVQVAKNFQSDNRTLLAVVDNIELENKDGIWKVNPGKERIRLWWDKEFEEERLVATRFTYTLPVEN